MLRKLFARRVARPQDHAEALLLSRARAEAIVLAAARGGTRPPEPAELRPPSSAAAS